MTWTVTLTHPTGSTITAAAVTRADARAWARQYRAIGDVVTIARLIPVESRPVVSLVKVCV